METQNDDSRSGSSATTPIEPEFPAASVCGLLSTLPMNHPTSLAVSPSNLKDAETKANASFWLAGTYG